MKIAVKAYLSLDVFKIQKIYIVRLQAVQAGSTEKHIYAGSRRRGKQMPTNTSKVLLHCTIKQKSQMYEEGLLVLARFRLDSSVGAAQFTIQINNLKSRGAR